MKRIFSVILCIVIPLAVFAADKQSGYKVIYDGGSLPDLKVGTGTVQRIKRELEQGGPFGGVSVVA